MSIGQQETERIAEQLLLLCRQAGRAIVEVYSADKPVAVELKLDDSPVTEADTRSHDIFLKGLAELTPQWPVLSEEQALPDFTERSQWPCYWLVDPLDGTREFIDRTGEFTINIALIENHRPVLGVVYIPLEQAAYLGFVEQGRALRIDSGGRREIAVSAATPALNDSVRVISSSRYGGAEFESCITKLAGHFQQVERVTAGSALKFCRLAEGAADIYPRFSPCCEWDTAAGQAVLEAAGGSLVDIEFNPLVYNRQSSVMSPNFYALGGTAEEWAGLFQAGAGS
ncbi:MAG: 3'(2'),5'-bisphosphate nucleotidase CysQ [Oceanicoccus sp.]|uniref:3'(2'),5'-bisphosphate nucleotidase CysQ n=1 Tax=Oceanicoccus sp. TaxID=2691044 RepID=UPI00261ABC7D|nr:3'(2'),5'-bisphosphate nucleotidase CysQ [Oceanicoccus sp.]MCP3907573.1 3'(2'),5'-bisphosphate nucleotidase CysQ [Oceanicoccus sp.]MDG1772385.1 3'(2'),5'-bisphosphate nucleotidase CysQ [Oceanicoccus sp.]